MMNFFDAVFNWNDNGRIGIVTEKGYYVAGELVKGHIIASIKRPIEATAVVLQIVGYEAATWEVENHRFVQQPPGTMSDDGRTPLLQKEEWWYEYQHGGNEFFNQKFVISQLNGAILNPGEYRFPFQYQLPKGLPGVFFEQRRRTQPRRGPRGQLPWEEQVEHHHRKMGGGMGGGMSGGMSGGMGGGYGSFGDEKMSGGMSGGGVSVNFSMGGGGMGGGGGSYRHDHMGNWRRFYGNWQDEVEMESKVAYMFHATLDVSGFFSRDLYATQPLIVHEALDNVRPASDQKTQEVTVCCCFGQGPATIKAWFDKNAYAVGETAVVTADIANNSKKEVRTMKIRLNRTLRIRSNGGRVMTYTNKMLEASYEGVASGQNKVIPMNLSFDPSMLVDKRVPFTPTCNGNIVNCTYSFDVKCDVRAASDVDLYMPVILYVPQPAKWGVNWDTTTQTG